MDVRPQPAKEEPCLDVPVLHVASMPARLILVLARHGALTTNAQPALPNAPKRDCQLEPLSDEAIEQCRSLALGLIASRAAADLLLVIPNPTHVATAPGILSPDSTPVFDPSPAAVSARCRQGQKRCKAERAQLLDTFDVPPTAKARGRRLQSKGREGIVCFTPRVFSPTLYLS